MRHIMIYPRLHIIGFMAITLCLAPPAFSNSAEAARARSPSLPPQVYFQKSRPCWGRYSAHPSQTRDGTIEEIAFRVPCPENVDASFIASLQRALTVRGFFAEPVTGKLDAPTRAALQAYQRAHGFNSPVLTLQTAQQLGLMPVEFSRE